MCMPVCVLVCASEYRCPWRTEKASYPATRVTVGYEPLCMDAGTWSCESLKDQDVLLVWMCDVHIGQERVLDPMKLELQIVLSHNFSAENRTWVLCKSNKCFILLSQQPSFQPLVCILKCWDYLSIPFYAIFLRFFKMPKFGFIHVQVRFWYFLLFFFKDLLL